jgi:hypothetical protein
MLRERYDPYSLFDAVPQLQLALEPELAELDRLLDDEPLFGLVRDDLVRRYPRTAETGPAVDAGRGGAAAAGGQAPV